MRKSIISKRKSQSKVGSNFSHSQSIHPFPENFAEHFSQLSPSTSSRFLLLPHPKFLPILVNALI